MGYQVSPVPLQIFHNPEYASDKDQDTSSEQGIEVSLPGDLNLHGGNEGQGLAEPEETSHADSHERAEEGDLDEEANNNDLFADIVEIEGPSSLDPPSTSLQGERDDIPRDKYLGELVDGYDREMLGVHGAYQATEYHVYGGGVQRGCNEDKNRLDNETADGHWIVVGPDPSRIPNDFDCEQEPVSTC